MSIEIGREVLRHEAAALLHLADRLDEPFETAVRWLLELEGRAVTCGLGKSGHIARKTAGTLASTGTPAFFLHAVEAVHGDLGMVTRHDVVLMYSHSGESDELARLFPALRSIGPRIALVTGRPDSTCGRLADLVLDTRVTEEACPHNLAPTTSATAMLALSDALALAVMRLRNFSREDYARFHPSGALGKRLLLKVSDVMRSGPDLALVGPEAPILEVMRAITNAGAGGACVVDEAGFLLGFISDGDLRRAFLRLEAPLGAKAGDLMTANPTTVDAEMPAAEALEMFQSHPRKIGDMPVLDRGRVVGLLLLKDLLRSGIV
ncbi:MAG: KpsF/GutQ family sugar-phosphate isomerase [Fimbriimonadales bacterium]|nr:KpsF/GutQ family sugar-phosphate isomerase [Fimbriimonadales bacterium]